MSKPSFAPHALLLFLLSSGGFVPAKARFMPPKLEPPPARGAAEAIPEALDLEVIAPKQAGSLLTPATPAEVQAARQDLSFPRLRALLERTLKAEWSTGQFNYALRDAFFEAFTHVQEHLPDLPVPAAEASREQKELYLFKTQGIGGNSVEIYSKIWLPLAPLDAEYGAKILNFAKSILQLRGGDPVPTTGRLLKDLQPEGDKAKANIPLRESLCLEGRARFRADTLDQFKGRMLATSEKLEQLNLRAGFSAGKPLVLYLRGPIGSGKTTFLKQHFDLTEAETGASDVIKMAMGGPLAHNEASSLADDLRKAVGAINYVDVRTNTRKFNTAEICERKTTIRIVFDLYVTEEVNRRRIEWRAQHQGGRRPGDAEIVNGLKEASENRVGIILAVQEDPDLAYHLYDNNEDGKPFLEIAAIQQGQLKVLDGERFERMCKADAPFREAIAKAFGKSPVGASLDETKN